MRWRKDFSGLFVLPVVHEELTQAEVRQVVIRVFLGHEPETLDLLGQVTHVEIRRDGR